MADNYKPILDKPINSPEEDFLGYQEEARNLVEIICNLEPQYFDESLVFAITGLWGVGKTSFLNLLETCLRNRQTKGECKSEIEIIKFNPWWFSHREDLYKMLLLEFSKKLKGDHRRLLEKFLYELDKLEIEAGVGLSTLGFLKIKKPSRSSKKTVHEIRQSIIERLQQENKLYVFIIDDIDRLSTEEIRDLFRTIKAITNFPRTVFILAYDYNIVAKALNNFQGEEVGENFLKKIVQVHRILSINQTYVQEYLEENLLSILGMSRQELDEYITQRERQKAMKFSRLQLQRSSEDIAEISFTSPQVRRSEEPHIEEEIRRVIFKLTSSKELTTLRDVKRLLNSIFLGFSYLRDKVYLPDFIAVRFLELFYPEVYEKLWTLNEIPNRMDTVPSMKEQGEKNLEIVRDILKRSGQQRNNAHVHEKPVLKISDIYMSLAPITGNYIFHQMEDSLERNMPIWSMEYLPELKPLIDYLFPKCSISQEQTERYISNKRLASIEHFPYYFKYSVEKEIKGGGNIEPV